MVLHTNVPQSHHGFNPATTRVRWPTNLYHTPTLYLIDRSEMPLCDTLDLYHCIC